MSLRLGVPQHWLCMCITAGEANERRGRGVSARPRPAVRDGDSSWSAVATLRLYQFDFSSPCTSTEQQAARQVSD
uniref:Uncharacterized protein n=1 Tax=Arundo donax TaxID=35708 RepID=A0A0A9B6V3_ARUDO